jgi:hypothetical protein
MKMKKITCPLGLWVAMGLPLGATAAPPSDIAVGQIDAILDHCAKLAPHLSPGATIIRHAATGEAAPGARGSAAYKQAYEYEQHILQSGNHTQQLAACTKTLKDLRHDDHGKHHESRDHESRDR